MLLIINTCDTEETSQVLRNDDYFELWLPMGVVLGASCFGTALTFFGSEGTNEWIYRYQSLVGAIVAVFTGSWVVLATVKASNRQIETSQKATNDQIQSALSVERERRADRLRGARAVLPFALTEIVDYCETAAAELASLRDQDANNPKDKSITVLISGSFTAPRYPAAVLQRITDVIESAPNEAASSLGELLVAIQICHSTLKGLEERLPDPGAVLTKRHLNTYIMQICALYARASRCFPFGRFACETISNSPLDQSEVYSSANILLLQSPDDDLMYLIEKNLSSTLPWAR